jgi:pyrimidine operon attenuation protein/uracil phosphoribosyltransferase
MKNIILNHEQIQHTTTRIAYQIYETFVDEEEIIIAGIAHNGLEFAKKIMSKLEQISPIKVSICSVNINKKKPQDAVTTTISASEYEGKCIVLVDDVLHSGTTLIYGVKHFLEVPLKKLKTVVLVDRNHKKFPVKADFKGISLSTSMHEHVQVDFKENEDCAYLI